MLLYKNIPILIIIKKDPSKYVRIHILILP